MRALTITNRITNRDARSVEQYLIDINKYEVLTPKEELELFQRFEAGDQRSLQKIIKHNLRFVVSVAKQYHASGLKLGDLINEGNIGLIKAAHRFDHTRGFKFISYAVWWIRQAIIHSISALGRKIRQPFNQQQTTAKILKIRERLLQDLDREPTHREIAEVAEMEEAQVEKNLAHYQYTLSLDAPVSSESTDGTLEKLIADSKVPSPDAHLVGRETHKIQVRQMLNTLPPRTAAILSLYYGIDRERSLTLDSIGEQMDLSRERVRQIVDRGIRKLRLRAIIA